MYECTVRFCFTGCPEHVVELLGAVPPLSGFRHVFARDGAEGADVVVAGPGLDAAGLAALAANPGPELLVLADGGVPLPAPVLERATDIWRLPMDDAELRFHFARWQERFKQGKDLWETGQFLECTLATTPNLIWFKTRDGIHEMVNGSFCRAVGKTRRQVQGRGHAYIWDVEADDPACIESERIVMESGETHVSEEAIDTGAGKRLLTVYKSPLRNVDGSMMGTMGIGVDVTQERLYQERLIQNNAALETIFTTMDCGCEQSRKLRISVTRIENSPDRIFKFGTVFVLKIAWKNGQRVSGAARVKTDTNRAVFLCLPLRRKHCRQSVAADVVILPRQFHPHIAAS